MKVQSAVQTTACPSIVAGITPDGLTIIFRREDYDNRGNVAGPYKVIGGIDKFYLSAYRYSKEDLKRLGWTQEEMAGVAVEIERFRRTTERVEKTVQYGNGED